MGKDTKTKKGHRGIKATLEERTQDARVGIQREQRQLLRVGDASQRGRDKAGRGMSRVYRVALEHRHRRVKQQGCSGRSSAQGERREGDSRVQRHGWKGSGTDSKGEA